MKKALTAALVAGSLFAATGAVADEIAPLTTTQSTSADSLTALSPELVAALTFLVIGGLIVSSSDGT